MICEGVEEGVARELKYRLGDYRKCEGVETELKGNLEEDELGQSLKVVGRVLRCS